MCTHIHTYNSQIFTHRNQCIKHGLEEHTNVMWFASTKVGEVKVKNGWGILGRSATLYLFKMKDVK